MKTKTLITDIHQEDISIVMDLQFDRSMIDIYALLCPGLYRTDFARFEIYPRDKIMINDNHLAYVWIDTHPDEWELDFSITSDSEIDHQSKIVIRDLTNQAIEKEYPEIKKTHESLIPILKDAYSFSRTNPDFEVVKRVLDRHQIKDPSDLVTIRKEYCGYTADFPKILGLDPIAFCAAEDTYHAESLADFQQTRLTNMGFQVPRGAKSIFNMGASPAY